MELETATVNDIYRHLLDVQYRLEDLTEEIPQQLTAGPGQPDRTARKALGAAWSYIGQARGELSGMRQKD